MKKLLHWLPAALCVAALVTGCSSTNSISGSSNNTGGGSSSGSGGGNPTPNTTNEWTWVSGSNSPNASGTYGTLGTASAANVPGARISSVTWTDSSGSLWLFGGSDNNDLWKYSPSSNEWTWVSGSDTTNAPGVYGTQGVAASANVPGARSNATGWTDTNGNLWLFGGTGPSVNTSDLNDLWKFNPTAKTWTWVSGNSTVDAPGIYGTVGNAAASNVPGARFSAVSWTDPNGNFWLFGGQGYDSTGMFGSLNDLWEFNPSTNEWTWVSGANTANASGVYGTEGAAAATNVPGSRSGAVSWTDSSGNFWLFGGTSATGFTSDLNDLWEFVPSQKTWTWVSGSNTTGTAKAGVYGTEGVAASGNVPGSRCWAVSWIDSSGNLWLFGGQGYDSTGTVNGDLNDLWKFTPSTKQWTWMGGSSTIPSGSVAAAGVYGTLGVAAATNMPGGRDSAVGWTDKNGTFWLFGGEVTEFYNDLWSYTP